jgi:hypothetical protein
MSLVVLISCWNRMPAYVGTPSFQHESGARPATLDLRERG